MFLPPFKHEERESIREGEPFPSREEPAPLRRLFSIEGKPEPSIGKGGKRSCPRFRWPRRKRNCRGCGSGIPDRRTPGRRWRCCGWDGRRVKGARRDRGQRALPRRGPRHSGFPRASRPFFQPQKAFQPIFRGKGQGARSELPHSSLRSTALQLHRTTRKWRLPRASRRKKILGDPASASRCRRSISSMVYTDHAKPCGNGCPHYPARPELYGSLCLPYLPRYAPNTKNPAVQHTTGKGNQRRTGLLHTVGDPPTGQIVGESSTLTRSPGRMRI